MPKRTKLTTNLEFRTCHSQEFATFSLATLIQECQKIFTKIEWAHLYNFVLALTGACQVAGGEKAKDIIIVIIFIIKY